MTTQEKIDKIYEVIANKTLSFGCRIKIDKESLAEPGYWYGIYIGPKVFWNDLEKLTTEKQQDLEIIGHPVMIGDVLDWYGIPYDILENRKFLRKPIEEQSKECIDFIYSLIEANETNTNTNQ